VDEIAAHSDSCVVGVLLLQAIVHPDPWVCDVAFVVIWGVLALDENDSVGAFADSGDALSKATKFFCVGFAPQLLVLRDHQ
jgi:hypothetical protein